MGWEWLPCWDDERVEFYIDSKGLLRWWESGVLHWLQGACALLRWWQWSFILTPRGLCLVEMMTVEFYIDSKGLQLKESLSPSPSSFCCWLGRKHEQPFKSSPVLQQGMLRFTKGEVKPELYPDPVDHPHEPRKDGLERWMPSHRVLHCTQ